MDCSPPGFPVLHHLPVGSNSCPLSQWCQPVISWSVVSFCSTHMLWWLGYEYLWKTIIQPVCLCFITQSCPTLWPRGLYPVRLLCPWGFSRLEYWSVLPCPPPDHLPNSGIESTSPALQVDSLPAELPGTPHAAYNTQKLERMEECQYSKFYEKIYNILILFLIILKYSCFHVTVFLQILHNFHISFQIH